jgi:myo-inositol-1(or 4)-monophosphatase
MSLDLNKIFNTAMDAALKAGNYLKSAFDKGTEVEYKGAINLVTENDRQSQRIIGNIIRKNYPSHSILGEEDLKVENREDLLWVIDPLDGTTNFARSLPAFCISIAFMKEGKTEVGIVHIPLLAETFHAIRGSGSFLNQRQIHVSKEDRISHSLLATGFPYDRRESKINNIEYFKRFIKRALGIRRMGSAAIDLCYTAAGRFDGFWELKLYPWDTAAGFLLVEEAGGRVTDFSGNQFDPFKKECLASNGAIHLQMLDIIHL